MKNRSVQGLLALLTLALVACGETGTDVEFDDLTPDEQLELSVLDDSEVYGVALELTDETMAVADARGDHRAGGGRALIAQARILFGTARDAHRDGEHRRALQAAREARMLVVQALRELGGDAALEALIERIEALALTAEDDVFEDADAVRAELERIAAEARALLEEGETLAAAARALLGEQLARHWRGRRDHPDIDVDRARLAVSLAGTSVALAERLLSDGTVTDVNTDRAEVRNRWLAHARRMLALSERALEAGLLRRAVHFAHHAHWSALKAVILPGGIEDEELRAMVELAEGLLEEATAAVGDDPTELQAELLERAGRWLEVGVTMLEEGRVRGVAAVWRSAVLSAWLVS